MFRRLFPAAGPRYELFDAGVLLAILGLIGYVFTTPPERISDAAPIQFFANPVWGFLLAIAGIFAAWCSYQCNNSRVELGFKVMIWVPFFWACQFAYVLITDQSTLRTTISLAIYASISSRMWRMFQQHQDLLVANRIRLPNTFLCPPCMAGSHGRCQGASVCDCKHKDPKFLW